jgi:hypothetical protein
MADLGLCSTLILKSFLATERSERSHEIYQGFHRGAPRDQLLRLGVRHLVGAILVAVGLGPGGFAATPQHFQQDVPYAVPAMILGPGLAGILLTAFLHGRAGLREFRSRLLKWRVGAQWYAVAQVGGKRLRAHFPLYDGHANELK